VIDHGATFVPGDYEASKALAASDAGDFIYRWGNPSAYQQGDPPGFMYEADQQMYGAHDIQWIGGPKISAKNTVFTASQLSGHGIGNFLIFDNGCYNPRGHRSVVVEINPYIAGIDEETGEPIISDSYVNPPDAGYDGYGNSNQIVWSYRSHVLNSFYSSHISGNQRLPNGNTLICSGAMGHIFEVTKDGEVVWEYINPVRPRRYNGPAKRPVVIETIQKDSHGQLAMGVFRALRFGFDHPAFVGKDLTPQGTITGRPAATVEQLIAAGTANMTLSYQLAPAAEAGWVKISGTAMYGETPLCAMILANGQYISCDPDGEYELEVPLDENGEITLFGFVDGFAPFKEIVDGGI